ncbi:MAG TPA: hypothetical protein PLO27_05420, partial [Marmoricola sp.]|nr:hypothetical protein [Marmoricola sp.]
MSTPTAPRAGTSPWKAITIGVVVLLLVVGMLGTFLLVVVSDRKGSVLNNQASTSSGPMPVGAEGLLRFYEQKITWRNCGGMDC